MHLKLMIQMGAERGRGRLDYTIIAIHCYSLLFIMHEVDNVRRAPVASRLLSATQQRKRYAAAAAAAAAVAAVRTRDRQTDRATSCDVDYYHYGRCYYYHYYHYYYY